MASNSLLTAHLVVQFSDAADAASVVAEVDDREDGYNFGKTTFYAGDNVYLLLFIPDGYEVDKVLTSAGTIAYVEDSTKNIEAYLPYANEDSASLSYPVDSGFAYTWLGTSLGVISNPDQFTAKLPARGYDTVTKKANPEYRVGVAYVTYKSACKVYKLYSVPANCLQVMVYFVVKKST